MARSVNVLYWEPGMGGLEVRKKSIGGNYAADLLTVDGERLENMRCFKLTTHYPSTDIRCVVNVYIAHRNIEDAINRNHRRYLTSYIVRTTILPLMNAGDLLKIVVVQHEQRAHACNKFKNIKLSENVYRGLWKLMCDELKAVAERIQYAKKIKNAVNPWYCGEILTAEEMLSIDHDIIPQIGRDTPIREKVVGLIASHPSDKEWREEIISEANSLTRMITPEIIFD